MSVKREKDLQRRVEQLEIALRAANEKLAQYEVVYPMAVGFVSGRVVSQDIARPILVSTQYNNKDIVLAVYSQFVTHVKQGNQYIFAGQLDGQFDTRCKTHHAILRAAHIFSTTLEPGDVSPRDRLAMFLITELINMFRWRSENRTSVT